MKSRVILTAALLAGVVQVTGQVRDEGWRYVIGPESHAELRGGDEADLNFGGADSILVQCGASPDEVSMLLLRYDLSIVDLTNTAHAVIYYRGDAEGDEGRNPSMAIYGVDNDWSEDEVTMNSAPRRRERISETTIRDDTAWAVAFFVTDYVRKYYHEGRVSFLVEMRSEPGFSKPMRFSGQASLTLAKVESPLYDFREIMYPVWRGRRVFHETLAPTSYEGGEARADLAFEPDRVLKVMDYGLQQRYEPGRDYQLDGRTLRLTPDSTIPFLRYEDLYHDDPDAKPAVMKTLDGGYLLLNHKLFNDHQLAVTYDRKTPWSGPVPRRATAYLPRTLEKLASGQPLKVVLFGDSISVGGDSSSKNDRAPFMPVWADLAAAFLKSRYAGPVDWVNPSLGGTLSQWGVETVDALAAFEKPDLAIIAFGMNDGGWVSVSKFMENTDAMMEAFRARQPDVEFILIAPIVPNPRWRDLTLMTAYREAMLERQGPGLAVADIWAIHSYLLERKTYWDINSNHVNHPNDYMARVYAQVISALLGAYDEP